MSGRSTLISWDWLLNKLKTQLLLKTLNVLSVYRFLNWWLHALNAPSFSAHLALKKCSKLNQNAHSARSSSTQQSLAKRYWRFFIVPSSNVRFLKATKCLSTNSDANTTYNIRKNCTLSVLLNVVSKWKTWSNHLCHLKLISSPSVQATFFNALNAISMYSKLSKTMILKKTLNKPVITVEKILALHFEIKITN